MLKKVLLRLFGIVGIITILSVIFVFVGPIRNISNENYNVKIVGLRGQGSGVVIQSNDVYSTILTNKHVCEINKMSNGLIDYFPFVVKEVVNNDSFLGHVKKVSKNTDLCLIQVEVGNLPVAKIAKKVVRGEKVINISSPLDIEGYKTHGFVGEVHLIPSMNFAKYQQVSTPIYPGSSGSAVFNMRKKIVGLITLGMRGANTLSYMVPLSDIKVFLKEAGLL